MKSRTHDKPTTSSLGYDFGLGKTRRIRYAHMRELSAALALAIAPGGPEGPRLMQSFEHAKSIWKACERLRDPVARPHALAVVAALKLGATLASLALPESAP